MPVVWLAGPENNFLRPAVFAQLPAAVFDRATAGQSFMSYKAFLRVRGMGPDARAAEVRNYVLSTTTP